MDSRLYLKGLILCVAILSQHPAHSQNWRDSLAVLNKQIATSPWSTDLHLRKAAVNLEMQQWEYAADEYGLVLEKDENNPAALFYRGYANTHLRRYDLARRDYEKLLTFVPRHAEARLSLAYVLQLMGRQQEALDQLNQTVELNPDSAVVWAARASLEREMKQHDAALYDWQQASTLDPQNASYAASHADLLITLERRDEARRVLDAAVRRGIPRGMLQQWYSKLQKK